jgi:hypothetical protein
MPVPGYRNAGDDGSPEAKLAAVIETASMSVSANKSAPVLPNLTAPH